MNVYSVILLVSSVGILASADERRFPVNADLSARPDLQKIMNSLPIPDEAASVSFPSDDGVSVEVSPTIAKWLNDLLDTKDKPRLPLKWEGEKHCLEIVYKLAVPPETKRIVQNGCQVYESPQLLFLDSNTEKRIPNLMSTIEGAIAVPLEPLMKVDNWTEEPFKSIRKRLTLPLRMMKFDRISNGLMEAHTALKDAKSKEKNPVEIQKIKVAEQKINALLNDLFEQQKKQRAQYEADHAKANSGGRVRSPLPYDTLTDDDRLFLSTIGGAIFWRLRGSSLWRVGSTTFLRKFYTEKFFDRLSELNSGKKLGGTGMLMRRALSRQGWGEWMDMGNTPREEDRIHDLVHMTLRGSSQVQGRPAILFPFPSVKDSLVYLGYGDAADLVFGGLQMGPCYDLAWTYLKNVMVGESLKALGENSTPPKPYWWFLEAPTAWGEVCTGAAIGEGFAKTLLKGRTP